MKISNHKVCAVFVYMPHSGHCSDEHEKVYSDLSDLLRKARRQKRVILMVCDFNAVVGRTNDSNFDNRIQDTACGQFGFGDLNLRGQRLLHFCMQENLSIANTYFAKRPEQLWTHRSTKCGGANNFRQINYIMIGSKDKW